MRVQVGVDEFTAGCTDTGVVHGPVVAAVDLSHVDLVRGCLYDPPHGLAEHFALLGTTHVVGDTGRFPDGSYLFVLI